VTESLEPHDPALSSRGPLVEVAIKIGASVAAPNASSVDKEGRFPLEAIRALQEAKLLSAFVPKELGGLGCAIWDLHGICLALGEHCANSAMVFAMHQIQIACLVRHGMSSPELRRYLQEEVVGKQALLGSATTEVNVGGDVRTSICAVETAGEKRRLRKQAPVISYGDQADAILATARRTPESSPGDQVIVLCRKDNGEAKLEKTHDWDALGFRGTCSNGYVLTANVASSNVLPAAYADISAQTMLPMAHTVWTSLWLGIATSAVKQARAFIRAEARKKPGVVPPASLRLAELVAHLQGLRANVVNCAREFQRLEARPDELSSMGFALRMNNVKLQVSEALTDIVGRAMRICGIAGYKQDSKYTLGRHLRDAWGAQLMVNNDRIYGANAQMLLIHKDE